MTAHPNIWKFVTFIQQKENEMIMRLHYDEHLIHIEQKVSKPSAKRAVEAEAAALAMLTSNKLTLDECLTRLANSKDINVVMPLDTAALDSSPPSSQTATAAAAPLDSPPIITTASATKRPLISISKKSKRKRFSFVASQDVPISSSQESTTSTAVSAHLCSSSPLDKPDHQHE